MALGSQDTKLSIWLSSAKRPTFVAQKLFLQSVVDLSWTPDGYCLLACSSDGTVAALQFEAKDLGVPLKQVLLLSLRQQTCCAVPRGTSPG